MSTTWDRIAAQLATELDPATVNQWIATTRQLKSDGPELTLEAETAAGAAWLSTRLREPILRALAAITGHPGKLVVLAAKPDELPAGLQPDDLLVTLVPAPDRRFLKVSLYSFFFWQPLLGCVAFATYQMIRSTDDVYTGSTWGKHQRISVQIIAETLAVNRQAITGVSRRRAGRKCWQPGAFDALNSEQIASIVPLGKGRSTIYDARIFYDLPMLTPDQLERLPPDRRAYHARFLRDNSPAALRTTGKQSPLLMPGHK